MGVRQGSVEGPLLPASRKPRKKTSATEGHCCTTTHCNTRCTCVSRAHARLPKEAWSKHRSTTMQVRRCWGKEMVARRNMPRGGAMVWPGLLSEILTCEKCGAKVRCERGLHLQQWCGQSAREAKTTSRLEAKTGMQGSERTKNWPCQYVKEVSPLDQTALLMSDIMSQETPHVSAQAPTTSESVVSENTVSAPAQTSDPAIAATSAQLQVEGKRNDGDNLEHGCKPTVETKRDSKRLRQKQPPRFLERRKDLRLTSSFWNLMGQTALRLRHSSSSCKTRLLTEGKTLTCSSKCFRRLSLMPATPSS